MVGELNTPKRGDIVWLNFDPSLGHEQKGFRPALILSHTDFNAKTGFAFICPITTKDKGYVFSIPLPKTAQTKGVILADQIRSVDWRSRNFRFVEKVNQKTVDSVIWLVCQVISPLNES